MQFNMIFEVVSTNFDTQAANDNKVMAVFSYQSWLVIIPLIASKSPFVRFHANQGLLLAIAEVIWNVLVGIISTILHAIFGFLHLGFIATVVIALLRIVNLAFFVISIIGIVDAVSGRARKFPLIGSFTLIK